MRWVANALKDPRSAGLACATGAVGIGVAYLIAAGAPMRLVAMNLAAWVVGLAAFATVAVPHWRAEWAKVILAPALGLVLLATALFGTQVEGAARWASVGPLNLQVSLIVLPAMILLFTQRSGASGALGLGIAAVALALQPDRAMAGVLAATMAALAVYRRERWVMMVLAAALAAFAVTLGRADELPAVAFVDQVFFSSFAIHPALGVAVAAGAVLLVLPALAGMRGPDAALMTVFGMLWGSVALAAALGNYPTPLVGYGGSAIVGYLLGLALLPKLTARAGEASPARREVAGEGDGRSLYATMA